MTNSIAKEKPAMPANGHYSGQMGGHQRLAGRRMWPQFTRQFTRHQRLHDGDMGELWAGLADDEDHF